MANFSLQHQKNKTKTYENEELCDNLAIQIGSRMIEQMGKNSVAHLGLSLATMTRDSVEYVQVEENLSNRK